MTIDILRNEYNQILDSNWRIRVKKFDNAGIYDLIVDLSHYLMVKCNIPNNMWLSVIRYLNNIAICRDKDMIPKKIGIFRKIYGGLSSTRCETHIYMKDYHLLELIEQCPLLN